MTAGVGAGLVIGSLVLFFVFRPWTGAPSAGGAGGEAPPSPITAGAPPEVKTQTVTIYQRADSEEFLLRAVQGQVIWFNAPVDRARQVVQLVLEGAPGETGAMPPGPPGLRYRDVYIAANGTAWVDLDGASLDELMGSDEEEALVGALARSLTEALEEIRAVGILVDGRPRETLAGHVDLTHTFTGREFPAAGAPPPPRESPGEAPAAPEESTAP